MVDFVTNITLQKNVWITKSLVELTKDNNLNIKIYYETILCNNTNYLAEVVAKKNVETLSTFEKWKNLLSNHIAKTLSCDTNKHDIIQTNMRMEITHNTNQ